MDPNGARPLVDFNGKAVLITGAGRGIGAGIAQALAELGAEVVVTDLTEAQGAETARLVEAYGRRALTLALDVTRRESIEAAAERTVATFGRIDGWVNNAGAIRMDRALDLDLADWDFQMKVNVAGLFAGCQVAARQMIRQGGGAIVNIASNAGKVGYRSMAAYNASKAAVINLTRSLALEWAEYNINVNAVCPGGVNTPMLQGVAEWLSTRAGDDPAERLKGMHPRQITRHILPVEVGRVVAFLLSPEAAIIRGQAINVDAGDTPY